MKTKTGIFSSWECSVVAEFIDKLYEEYGDRVINLLLDGPDDKYVLFYTIREDSEEVKQENID